MKIFSGNNCHLLMVATGLVLSAAVPLAWAIAPSDQTVGFQFDTANSPYYSVVEIAQNADGSGGTGTGAIIGKATIGSSEYAYVLTADHVADMGGYNNFVGLGVCDDSWTARNSQGFQETLVAAGGPNPTSYFEDLAIMRIDLTAYPGVYTSLTPLNVVNPSQSSGPSSFTEYGYGDTGAPGVTGNGVAGYSQVNRDFTLGFQNNTTLGLTITNYTAQVASNISLNANKPYQEPLLEWTAVAPANNFLQGTSFPGDSGGPYLSTLGTLIPVNRGGTVISNYSEMSDGLDAVHVLGFSPSLNGQTNDGVYINQANYDWIMSQIPEPSAASLVMAGICLATACGAVLSRRRKLTK
jgi:hypothetical protein